MIVNFLFLLFFCESVLAQGEPCENDCHFDGAEITAATIDSWPSKCERVCGNLFLTSNFSQTKLNSTFKNLIYLNGELHIQNTNITDTVFFNKLRMYYCGKDGIIISNNAKLKEINFMNTMYAYDARYCLVLVANNPKLNVSTFCEQRGFLNFSMSNNLTPCGCANVILDKGSITKYDNCTSITGDQGLRILNQFNGDSLERLSQLESVSKTLEVYKTDLKDLSFMSSLKSVTGEYYTSKDILNIHENPNMTRLGWTSLKNLAATDNGDVRVNITDLHPDFCLTTEEIQLFVDLQVKFTNLNAKTCTDGSRKDGQKLCVFGNMGSLESGCIHIRGHVLIDSGDEIHVEKLKTVKYIYGSLKIQNTQLTNFSCLSQLRNVAALKTFPSIQIISNKQLQSAKFANLVRPLALAEYTVMFRDNNDTLLRKRKDCETYQNSIEAYITVNGKDCYEYDIPIKYQEEDLETDGGGVGVTPTNGFLANPTDTIPSEMTTEVLVTSTKLAAAYSKLLATMATLILIF